MQLVYSNLSLCRDRSRAWDEALSKFDKCFPSISTRKRSRVGSSLNDRSTSSLPGDRAVLGGSITKLGTQNHVISSSFEHEPQKLEERTKTALPNKRIRTSMVDVRVCILDLSFEPFCICLFLPFLLCLLMFYFLSKIVYDYLM